MAPLASAAQPTLFQLPPATHAGAPAIGSDGAVWFGLGFGSAHEVRPGSYIGRLGPERKLIEIPVPKGVEVGEPVTATDGTVWFPEAGDAGRSVARFSPSGQVQSYPLENVTGIRSLTAMNGKLWFAGSGRIAGSPAAIVGSIAIATDGAVQEFALPARCYSNVIGAARGVVWFGERCGRKSQLGLGSSISRLDPSGQIVRHRIGEQDFPSSAAVGPEGTVWFGLSRVYGKQGIVRITPRGQMSVFRVPNASFSDSIAVGPKRRLWFSSSFGGYVYRGLNSIDSKGDVGTPICLDPKCSQQAYGFRTGPDGSLWFSTDTPHTIGGGGETQIIESETIANEAGFVGRLWP